jgi:hypothetical protein
MDKGASRFRRLTWNFLDRRWLQTRLLRSYKAEVGGSKPPAPTGKPPFNAPFALQTGRQALRARQQSHANPLSVHIAVT